MEKQTGIEAIQRHLEAIREIAREIGCAEYLSLTIMDEKDGYMAFNDRPKEEGFFSAAYYNESGWEVTEY